MKRRQHNLPRHVCLPDLCVSKECGCEHKMHCVHTSAVWLLKAEAIIYKLGIEYKRDIARMLALILLDAYKGPYEVCFYNEFAILEKLRATLEKCK